MLAYCWAHARRKLHEVAQNATAPIAEEGLRQIAALYQVEKDIWGLSANARLQARKDRSAPLIAAFEAWLSANRTRVSSKVPLGEALKYIAKYWDGLCMFLTDGRVEMDNNAVERAIRPIAIIARTHSLQDTTPALKTGRPSHRSLRLAYAARGISRFMPIGELCRAGSFLPTFFMG